MRKVAITIPLRDHMVAKMTNDGGRTYLRSLLFNSGWKEGVDIVRTIMYDVKMIVYEFQKEDV